MTIDQTHHSLSFNEYLTLISINRRAQPSEENLIDAFGYMTSIFPTINTEYFFSNFDSGNTGKISKEMFTQILKTKEVPEKDIQEMLSGMVTTNISLKHFYCPYNATCYSLQNRLSDRC